MKSAASLTNCMSTSPRLSGGERRTETLNLHRAMMRIVIPGGTGQVGTTLARAFRERGDEVIVLGRHPQTAPWRVVKWDAETLGDWTGEIEGADVVINLAGRSANCTRPLHSMA
jgi:putative NADH-flavin reductase